MRRTRRVQCFKIRIRWVNIIWILGRKKIQNPKSIVRFGLFYYPNSNQTNRTINCFRLSWVDLGSEKGKIQFLKSISLVWMFLLVKLESNQSKQHVYLLRIIEYPCLLVVQSTTMSFCSSYITYTSSYLLH